MKHSVIENTLSTSRPWVAALLATVILVLLGGCVRSLGPVLKDDQVVTDNAVVGHWASTSDENQFMEISAAADKTYSVVYHDKDGKTGNFTLRLGKVGDLTIAEISPAQPDMPDTADVYRAHLQPVYSFYWLTQTKPSLRGRTFKPDWFKQYVAAHPEELKVASAKDDLPLVTAPSDELQAFILRHYKDQDAITDEVTFVPTTAVPQPATHKQ
jgi:hypothetical protein